MTVFWLAATVMLLIAVACVVWPLLRRGPLSDLDQDELNLGLARERLQEWRTAFEKEEISEAEFDNLRSELEDTLLLELGSEGPIQTKYQPRAYLDHPCGSPAHRRNRALSANWHPDCAAVRKPGRSIDCSARRGTRAIGAPGRRDAGATANPSRE